MIKTATSIIINRVPIAKQYNIRYVPTVVVGDKKLEGLKAIREELISTIIEYSRS